MKIYLIRHGQTDWNLAGKIQGSTDIPLNETGKSQAQALAKGMEKRPVMQIFSSTLKRAVATAAAIGRSQKVDVDIIRGLEEVGFGHWEGMSWTEIQETYPEEYEKWCMNPIDVAPPGGESQREIYRRCGQVVEGIVAQAHGDVAIVSHGATMAYLIAYMMREHPLEEELIVENASITTIHYSSWTKDFTIMELNDVSHLQKKI